MVILYAILVLGGLGFFFGLGLAIASKKFCVVADPRVEQLLGCLPGANCGACGMPGCMGFAQSLIQGQGSLDACRVIEQEARKQAAGILGITLDVQVKQVAVLHCAGGNKTADRFRYNGIQDCAAAHLLLRGQKGCIYGCLGFGTCVQACPFDAIRMAEQGLPVIDTEKCRACGKCVEVCPKQLFSLIPVKSKVIVRCRSLDTAVNTRAVCRVGCIGCYRCQKECPVDAIHVIDNVAVIDYAKCISCGKCVTVCPVKCIVMNASSETLPNNQQADS